MSVIGNWSCSSDMGQQCCFHNDGSGESVGNIFINFTGAKGANLPISPCPTGKTCWLNFGGGIEGTGIHVHDYYTCTADDEQCEAGQGNQTQALTDVLKAMESNGYTGVTFDYEREDDSPPSLSEWKGLNKIFQDKGLTTALTMAKAGLGTDLKYGLKTDDDAGRANFVGNQVPFTYNIPQLYGGETLDTFFYTGEKNTNWDKYNFTGYGVGGDTPLTTLCNSVHKDTKVIPSFGAQPPVGGLDGVKKLCEQYDGTSFISWSINNPNTDQGCGGTSCQKQDGTCTADPQAWCSHIPSNACSNDNGFDIGSYKDGFICDNLRSCCDKPDKFLQCYSKGKQWSSDRWCNEKAIQTVCAGGKYAYKSQDPQADTVCRYRYYYPQTCPPKVSL